MQRLRVQGDHHREIHPHNRDLQGVAHRVSVPGDGRRTQILLGKETLFLEQPCGQEGMILLVRKAAGLINCGGVKRLAGISQESFRFHEHDPLRRRGSDPTQVLRGVEDLLDFRRDIVAGYLYLPGPPDELKVQENPGGFDVTRNPPNQQRFAVVAQSGVVYLQDSSLNPSVDGQRIHHLLENGPRLFGGQILGSRSGPARCPQDKARYGYQGLLHILPLSIGAMER